MFFAPGREMARSEINSPVGLSPRGSRRVLNFFELPVDQQELLHLQVTAACFETFFMVTAHPSFPKTYRYSYRRDRRKNQRWTREDGGWTKPENSLRSHHPRYRVSLNFIPSGSEYHRECTGKGPCHFCRQEVRPGIDTLPGKHRDTRSRTPEFRAAQAECAPSML